VKEEPIKCLDWIHNLAAEHSSESGPSGCLRLGMCMRNQTQIFHYTCRQNAMTKFALALCKDSRIAKTETALTLTGNARPSWSGRFLANPCVSGPETRARLRQRKSPQMPWVRNNTCVTDWAQSEHFAIRFGALNCTKDSNAHAFVKQTV
jgi:hypothetical protein